MLFSLERGDVQLDVGILLVEVGHFSRLDTVELELFHDLLFDFLLNAVCFLNRLKPFGRERESLLHIALVLALDGVNRGLTSLFLVVLDVCQRLFVHVLGRGSGLDFSLDLLGRWNHFRLWLCQVERLELSFFRLLLLLAAI